MTIGAGAVASGFHFGALRWHRGAAYSSSLRSTTVTQTWAEAVEKVEADRGPGSDIAVETPPELRHYENRHWFLASQVAEVAEHQIQTCRDFVDLAGMIQRGEMVTVPAVTDTYVLYGVGEETDDEPFTKYQELPDTEEAKDSKSKAKPGVAIELYSPTYISQAYKEFDDKRLKVQHDIDDLKTQMRSLKKGEQDKQKELQKQVSTKEQELKSLEEKKTRVDKFYGDSPPDSLSKSELFRDYETLHALAQNFSGTVYNLDDPASRKAMKGHMLSSLRPEALRVLEQVAGAYHTQFGRPLPVSSLVRPEQYQHALRRVNRNAVMIETPPHSTGLAFDIDYRWMSGEERKFVMAELARMKNEGRIEVIRERNANYHVFAFIDGKRPSDELVTASLEAAGADPLEDAEGADAEEAKPAVKKAATVKSTKSKPVKRRAAAKRRR